MGYDFILETEKSLFTGKDVAKAMAQVLDSLAKRLNHKPLLELKKYDFTGEVAALEEAIETTLQERPLPDKVNCLLLCINEEADPAEITLHGAATFSDVCNSSFLYPPIKNKKLELSVIIPSFFCEIQRLKEELGFDPDSEEEAADDGGAKAEREFHRREAIFDLLEGPLNLRYLAAAMSFICKGGKGMKPFDPAKGKREFDIAVMLHSASPIFLGRIAGGKWTTGDAVLKKASALSLLKQGPSAVNLWRTANPGKPRNLNRAKLEGMDLSGFDLSGADMELAKMQGVKLDGARLVDVNLQSAKLQKASLKGAVIQKSDLKLAHLDNACLQGAQLIHSSFYALFGEGADFRDALIDACDFFGADLDKAKFAGARIRSTLIAPKGTLGERPDLRGAIFERGEPVNPEHVAIARQGAEAIARWRKKNPNKNLYLTWANLSGADLRNANLIHTEFTGADLTKARLDGAKLESDLVAVLLDGASFNGAKIYIHMSDAKIVGATFHGADVQLSLPSCELISVDFREARLDGDNFNRSVLEEVDFTGAVLNKIQFRGTTLRKCRFDGATLKNCIFEQAKIQDCSFESTKMEGTTLETAKSSKTSKK